MKDLSASCSSSFISFPYRFKIFFKKSIIDIAYSYFYYYYKVFLLKASNNFIKTIINKARMSFFPFPTVNQVFPVIFMFLYFAIFNSQLYQFHCDLRINVFKISSYLIFIKIWQQFFVHLYHNTHGCRKITKIWVFLIPKHTTKYERQ